MRSSLNRLRQRLQSRDEAGFTLIEMVIAIPLTMLYLGVILTTIGVTNSLLAQINASAGAVRVASSAVDELSESASCAELSMAMGQIASNNADRFAVEFGEFSCERGTSFPVELTISSNNGAGTPYYSNKITLAVR